MAALGTAALLAACGSTAERDSQSAACAAPTLSVNPGAVTAGDQVQVVGENFLSGCPNGAGQDASAMEAPTPHTSINIQVMDAGIPVTLETVDAGDDGTFEVGVTLPDALPAGVVEV